MIRGQVFLGAAERTQRFFPMYILLLLRYNQKLGDGISVCKLCQLAMLQRRVFVDVTRSP